MGDAQIFAGGVFVTLWLVSFFGYSAFQLRRGYQVKPSSAERERVAPVRTIGERAVSARRRLPSPRDGGAPSRATAITAPSRSTSG